MSVSHAYGIGVTVSKISAHLHALGANWPRGATLQPADAQDRFVPALEGAPRARESTPRRSSLLDSARHSWVPRHRPLNAHTDHSHSPWIRHTHRSKDHTRRTSQH